VPDAFKPTPRKRNRRGPPPRRERIIAVALERRIGKDRRVLPDRRRDTPAMFSPEETAQVRAQILESGTEARCPRCGGSLTVGPTTTTGEESVREVRCSACHRGVLLIAVS